MFKVINVTAVPFHLAKLQSTATKNIFQRTAEISSNYSLNNVPILTSIQNINVPNQKKTHSSTSPSTLNERMMKKRNRILKNRLAAKASREKWRLHKNLLEQQLQNLKEEKMRLLLENEELRLQHNHLEDEHICLKRRFEDDTELRCRVPEDSFEHAEGMGSSTLLHLTPDDTWRDFQQLPVATVPDIPLIEDLPDFEQLFEFSEASSFYEGSDVFVCPLSQDMTKETLIHDSTAVARTVSQEIEVSCSDEEMSPTLELSSEQEMKLVSEEVTDLTCPVSSYPQMWTFDNLYEDIDDGISLFS